LRLQWVPGLRQGWVLRKFGVHTRDRGVVGGVSQRAGRENLGLRRRVAEVRASHRVFEVSLRPFPAQVETGMTNDSRSEAQNHVFHASLSSIYLTISSNISILIKYLRILTLRNTAEARITSDSMIKGRSRHSNSLHELGGGGGEIRSIIPEI
jgi:hypothetical protein